MTAIKPALATAGALAFIALTACSSEASAPTTATSGVVSSMTSAVTAGDPLSVVVDYSPTPSDVDALLFLAANQRVDLLAVTLAGTGESRCEAGRITGDVMGADVRVAGAPDGARFESALLAGLNGATAATPG